MIFQYESLFECEDEITAIVIEIQKAGLADKDSTKPMLSTTQVSKQEGFSSQKV